MWSVLRIIFFGFGLFLFLYILFASILQVDFMCSVLRFILLFLFLFYFEYMFFYIRIAGGFHVECVAAYFFLILFISTLQVDFMWSVLRFIVIVAVPYLVVRTLMEGIDSLNATRFAQGYVSCRSLLAL